jgi:hypothetical protein
LPAGGMAGWDATERVVFGLVEQVDHLAEGVDESGEASGANTRSRFNTTDLPAGRHWGGRLLAGCAQTRRRRGGDDARRPTGLICTSRTGAARSGRPAPVQEPGDDPAPRPNRGQKVWPADGALPFMALAPEGSGARRSSPRAPGPSNPVVCRTHSGIPPTGRRGCSRAVPVAVQRALTTACWVLSATRRSGRGPALPSLIGTISRRTDGARVPAAVHDTRVLRS